MRATYMKIAIVLLALVPLGTLGLASAAFLAPHREPAPGPWFKVATLGDLREDGEPIRAMITVPAHDAWAQLPDRFIGYVFVRRLPGDAAVVALRAEHHPFLHIAVNYDATKRLFHSTCWNLSFDLDGKEIMTDDLPPVGHEIERLPVHLDGADIWVRYEKR